jgi:hypothetical protein
MEEQFPKMTICGKIMEKYPPSLFQRINDP